jgi:hypothetical protein
VLKGSLEAGVHEGFLLRNQEDNTEIRCSLALLGSDGLLLNLAEWEGFEPSVRLFNRTTV